MPSDWLPSFGKARTGPWYDHGANEQWSTTDISGSRMATWAVAFAVTLSLKYVLLILAHAGLRVICWSNRRPARHGVEERLLPQHPRDYGATHNGSPSPTRGHAAPGSDTLQYPGSFSDVLRDSKSGRELTWNHLCFLKNCLLGTRPKRNRLRHFVLGLAMLGLLAGITILGFFAPFKVAVDGKPVLLTSDVCGVWIFNPADDGADLMAHRDTLDRDKEVRAGEYERSCYNRTGFPYPGFCDAFAERRVPIEEPDRAFGCPFDDDICATRTGNLFLDTGRVDANAIGINVEKGKYSFRRSTACAPLKTDDPYVQNNTDTESFSYYYGNTTDRENTFQSEGTPFNDVPVPGYDLTAFATSFKPEVDAWTPIPKLRKSNDKIVTILFISPLHVLYDTPTFDPVFEATAKVKQPDGASSGARFARGNPIYGVLACVDDYQLCNSTDCWPLADQEDARSRSIIDPAYWHMHLALERSNIYDATAKRLGSSLVASRMLSQYSSPGLASDHWKTEATHWFGTSLARIQFDAWSIATGEGHDVPTYYDATPDVVKEGRLCGRFKFKNPQFTNIRLAALIPLVLMPVYTFILHCRVADIAHHVRCRFCWRVFGPCERHAEFPGPEAAAAAARDPDGVLSPGRTSGDTAWQARVGGGVPDNLDESSTIAAAVDDGDISVPRTSGMERNIGNGGLTGRARWAASSTPTLESRGMADRLVDDEGETAAEFIFRPATALFLWVYGLLRKHGRQNME